MEPYRISGLKDVFPALGTNMGSSSSNAVPYANSHGLDAFYGNYHSSEVYYGSPSMLDHAVCQPPIPAPMAPRVHINPNYRPKVSGHQSSTLNRPASVHINPHWKGRLESAVRNEDQVHGLGSSAGGKKTIFVNPKVLSHLSLQQPPHHIESIPAPGLHLANTRPSQEAAANVSLLPCDTRNTSSQSTELMGRNEVHKDVVLAKCSPERSFVVLNSRKLIRKTNTSQCNKLPSQEGSKKINTSAIKVARQVASKYKLVRNPSTVPNVLKPVKCVSAAYSKRTRRKSANLKLLPTANFSSAYKFIRQTEDCAVPLKMGSKSDQFIASPRANCDTFKRCLKSRYKLIKVHSSQQKGHTASVGSVKAKPVLSRYKLIRHGLRESKSAIRNSSMCSLSLYSSPIRTKFRGFYTSRPNYGRKVSRFRLVQTSLTKSGTQAQIPSSVSHSPSNYTKSSKYKSGLYKNISWQKERLRPLAHPKSYQTGVRNTKNSVHKNGTSILSSKKILNRSLVNIGGVLYRSTRTTLTRTCIGKANEKILHIRGKKFVMDDKGKTIRPASSPEDGLSNSKEERLFSRVDIGGVTFTRRSDNTLVRTNTHYARNLLSLAKMRSIALLTDKLRKNNQPCLIYHRFGKCLSHIAGKCSRVHDPRNISICRRFLQGICDNEKCLLSHDVGPEKMPTCRYFLEGCCVRDNCPYLHVKLSANAAICRQFLHGYCDAGDKCKKRHVFLCPEFEKDGNCSKGKFCPYPHTKGAKQNPKRKRIPDTKHLKSSCNQTKTKPKKVHGLIQVPPNETEKIKRYYDESSPCETPKKAQLCPDSDTYDASSDSEKDTVQRRSKIGILPAYIPL